MNQWDQSEKELETELCSWRLREPRARIKDRLFGRAKGEKREGAENAAGWGGWLNQWSVAGATVLALLLSVGWPALEEGAWNSAMDAETVEVVALSNPLYAAYLPSGGHSSMNVFSSRMEWRSGAAMAPRMAEFVRWTTNGLMR